MKFLDPELVDHLTDGWRKAGLEVDGATAVAASPSGQGRADEGFWVAVLPFKSTGTSSELAPLWKDSRKKS